MLDVAKRSEEQIGASASPFVCNVVLEPAPAGQVILGVEPTANIEIQVAPVDLFAIAQKTSASMADEEEMSTVTAVAEAAVEGHEEEEQTRPEEAAAAVEAAEAEAAPAAKKKIQRKPKRRTMDAHFWGMSDAEIASIKASLAAEAEAAASSNEGGNKDATPVAAIDGEQQEDKQKEQSEQVEEEEIIPEGQLPKKEIEERRRILHTDWRMAAFSQFAHCFPHLCIKEFSIEKLERDLDGTDPGSYVGEVISRLLYHLTKDSSLA